jgi:hypothetical protein
MISILGLDLDACMIRFLVSISMHAAGRAAARAAATVVFSPFRDLAAMHTGGGSGRSAEAGDGSECSLSMRMRLSCHAVKICACGLAKTVFSKDMCLYCPFEHRSEKRYRTVISMIYMLAVKLRPMQISRK